MLIPDLFWTKKVLYAIMWCIGDGVVTARGSAESSGTSGVTHFVLHRDGPHTVLRRETSDFRAEYERRHLLG